MLLTGLKIKNTSSFEESIIQSIDTTSNQCMMYNLQTQEVKPFVLSRIVKGLQKGSYTDMTKERKS